MGLPLNGKYQECPESCTLKCVLVTKIETGNVIVRMEARISGKT